MSPPDPPDLDRDGPGEAYKLVCGLCEAVLDETYPDRADADQAADEHVHGAHPDHRSVVVLAVSLRFIEEHPSDALSIAIGAHERVARRHRDEQDGS